MTADEKQMKLRYAGVCRLCGAELAARAEAIYERSTKTVRCLDCSPADPTHSVVEEVAQQPSRNPNPIDSGTPGASARREYERRQAKRESRIREKHPKLGGLILVMSDDPQSTTAWDTGAVGEERLGQRLNELSSDALRVLHDRRIPGTRANIDHIAVTPTGIYVIDAKKYKGRPSLKVEGGIVRPRVERLMVGTRDQTKLVDGVLKQVEVVRGIVGDAIPVTGVLCFVEADWPLIGGAFTTRGVEVLWPRKLYTRLTTEGPIASGIDDLHGTLAYALPPACLTQTDRLPDTQRRDWPDAVRQLQSRPWQDRAMMYHAEFLGEVLHKAFTDFDPDDNADALRLVLNDYKERGLNLLTSVNDPNSNSPILVFTVYQSGDDA